MQRKSDRHREDIPFRVSFVVSVTNADSLRRFRMISDRKLSVCREIHRHPALRLDQPLGSIGYSYAQGPAEAQAGHHAPRSAVGSLDDREHRERSEWVNRATQDLGCLRTIGQQESATNDSCRGPSRGCVHRWTSAGNPPQNSHFFSLFGPPGVIPTCRDSIGKPFHPKQIGHDSWLSRASKTPCGTWDPKFSYRFPLIVHYLEGSRQWAAGSGPWKKTCARFTRPSSPWRSRGVIR